MQEPSSVCVFRVCTVVKSSHVMSVFFCMKAGMLYNMQSSHTLSFYTFGSLSVHVSGSGSIYCNLILACNARLYSNCNSVSSWCLLVCSCSCCSSCCCRASTKPLHISIPQLWQNHGYPVVLYWTYLLVQSIEYQCNVARLTISLWRQSVCTRILLQ